MKEHHLPFVSIIVPAYNEAKHIGSCLESLENLNYPRERYEIVVIDNGSSDETISIAKKYTPKIYVCPNLTISALRNYGARKAVGEIYAFIDADCVADKEWLRSTIESLKDEYCVIGSKVAIPLNATWLEKAWFSQKRVGRFETSYINSGNLIVPSDIFIKVGMFNERLVTGEDYEFCLRARRVVRVISDDRVKVTHLGNPKTLGQFLRREIWHGLGAFGSFRIKRFDKPLIGTILFLFMTLLQVAGLIYAFFAKSENLFVFSSIGILLLLTATIWNQTKLIELKFTDKIRFLLLYYLFYLGRSISLFFICCKYPVHRVR